MGPPATRERYKEPVSMSDLRLSLETEGQAELTVYPSNLRTAFTAGDGNATPLSDSLLGLGFGLETVSLSMIILLLILASY